MKQYCQCCSRQIVSYKANEERIVGGEPSIIMVNGLCCFMCAKDLDENGLFPEERELNSY